MSKLHPIRLICLLSLSLPWLTGCDDISEPPAPRRGVLEGRFSSNGFPEVLFSHSIVPEQEGSLKGSVLNWAKVTISDGEREVVMTGTYDKTRLPPFRYHTSEMEPEPGKVYTVRAVFGEYDVSASCRMPYPTPIDRITLSRAEADSMWAPTLHFTSPEDTPAYYYLTMRENKRGSHDGVCMIGSVVADKPMTSYSIPVFKPKIKIDDKPYVATVKTGEEWIVSLNRVEREVYDFWKAYDNMLLFSSSPFISSSESLPSNIENGLGVWSPQGSSSILLQVP